MAPSRLHGSHFADASAVREAIDMALPMIERAMKNPDVCGSGFLYIVVMDPGLSPGEVDFADAVLVEHALGDRTQWDADYAGFARGKARLSWQSGLGSHEVQATRTHALRHGDSVLWGSVCLDGIVVGVSGAHPWFDEAFATAIAANVRAIAKSRHALALAQGHWVAGGPQA
ncbi:MAG TPA: hypothetical protein VF169_07440 [Albitalea sp.]|uniref:hypothetical protein n=1 Tax=Piscinibacter sp. TaxID=1903157 RepID=UPI002ED47F89